MELTLEYGMAKEERKFQKLYITVKRLSIARIHREDQSAICTNACLGTGNVTQKIYHMRPIRMLFPLRRTANN